jgi:hypothetical protein
MNAQDLVGTWRLRTWRNVGSDGSVVEPLGERPVGYIFYNRDRYMSVAIMAGKRAPYRDPDLFGGNAEERSGAISTYLSYSGPYELLPEQNAVIHHVEVCSFPNWVGTDQKRLFRFEGNRLTLEADQPAGRSKLVWERVR